MKASTEELSVEIICTDANCQNFPLEISIGFPPAVKNKRQTR
jgi:hypothetical protein